MSGSIKPNFFLDISSDFCPMTFVKTKLQLQKSASECGVFSLWYIWLRLNEYPSNVLNEPSMATDKIMYQFRTYIFRKCN